MDFSEADRIFNKLQQCVIKTMGERAIQIIKDAGRWGEVEALPEPSASRMRFETAEHWSQAIILKETKETSVYLMQFRKSEVNYHEALAYCQAFEDWAIEKLNKLTLAALIKSALKIDEDDNEVEIKEHEVEPQQVNRLFSRLGSNPGLN